MSYLKQIWRRRGWRVILSVLAVMVVGGVAYGQTLEMYFWQDDSALMFKLQHPEGAAGSFGAGIIGEGPYKYLVTPFVPFYSVFGLNPQGYFAVGWVWYLVTVAVFYWFALGLFQKRDLSYVTTLVFAAGYVGSEISFRIINSWQSGMGLALALVSFGALVRCLRGKGWGYYFLSVLAFWAATEFIYIRSHSLIGVFLVLFGLLAWPRRRFVKWLVFVAGQVPFVVIFYEKYLAGGDMGVGSIGRLAGSLLSGKVEVLAGLFATAGNVFISDVWQGKLIAIFGDQVGIATLTIFGVGLVLYLTALGATKKMRGLALLGLLGGFLINHYFAAVGLYWFRTREAVLSGAEGWYMCVAAAVLAGSLWRRRKDLALGVILGWVIVMSQIFGYFIQYQDAIFGTTHRYLHYSLVGFALFWGAVGLGVYETGVRRVWRVLGALSIALLVGSNLFFGFRYQNQIVAQRSEPVRRFYQDLKRLVPQVRAGAVFYFDVADDGVSQQQFRDCFSVGSMPETTAIAIYYGVDRDEIKLLTDFDELVSVLAQGEAKVGNLYAFHYDSRGLVNETDEVRQLLTEGTKVEELTSDGVSPLIFAKVEGVASVTPLLFEMEAKVVPSWEGMKFPYNVDEGEMKYSMAEKELMLDYFLARKGYYEKVQASSLSEWKYQEVKYAVDGDVGTSWRGHRIYWHEHHHDQLIVDLSKAEEIDRVVWTNWNHTLTPTDYTIDVSVDGVNWRTMKQVKGGGERADGERVIETFEPVTARWVRMDVKDTLDNDAPAISEIEVVERAYRDVDLNAAEKWVANPFSNVPDRAEMAMILGKIAPLLPMNVSWKVDGEWFEKRQMVGEFNKLKRFEYLLSARGMRVEEIKVGLDGAPVEVELAWAGIRNVALKELEERGWVKSYAEN